MAVFPPRSSPPPGRAAKIRQNPAETGASGGRGGRPKPGSPRGEPSGARRHPPPSHQPPGPRARAPRRAGTTSGRRRAPPPAGAPAVPDQPGAREQVPEQVVRDLAPVLEDVVEARADEAAHEPGEGDLVCPVLRQAELAEA